MKANAIKLPSTMSQADAGLVPNITHGLVETLLTFDCIMTGHFLSTKCSSFISYKPRQTRSKNGGS